MWLSGVRRGVPARLRQKDPSEAGDEDARLIAAREAERNRLHQDLHDGAVPRLASVRLRLEAVAAGLDHAPTIRRLIVDAAADTEAALDEVRRIVDDLRPPELEQFDLIQTLHRLVARMSHPAQALSQTSQTSQISPLIRADLPESELTLPPSTEVAAYRIAAEALTNAVRHSAASHVLLRLRTDRSDIVLEVADDGVGLSPGAGLGVGLSSMAQRAAEVGGSCQVVPWPERWSGTLVRAVLPRKPR